MAPKAAGPAGESKRVLVVFLVFFILSTIGAGLAAYYGFAEQAKLEADAKKAKQQVIIANEERDYTRIQLATLRAYVGMPADPNSPVGRELDKKAEIEAGAKPWDTYKDLAEVKDIFAKLNQRSPWDAVKKVPRETYEDLVKALKGEIDLLKKESVKANFDASVEKVRQTATQTDRTNDQTAFNTAIGQIKEEFKKERDNYAKQIDMLDKELKEVQNKKDETIVQPLLDKVKKLEGTLADMTKQIKERDERIVQLSARLPSNVAGAVGADDKPSELTPRGKIVRVHINPRKVTIDLGKSHGLTAQTTFAIHGYQANGKPKVRSKANLEVINVGESSSECLITEVFHPDPNTDFVTTGKRKVIDLFSPAATDPVVAGDALINPTWNPNSKTHIVIAGLIDLAGSGAINMASFVQVLEKQNIIVDAYVDPIDGTIKGRGLGKQTDFVLLGNPPVSKDAADAVAKTMTENINKLVNDAKAIALPMKQPHIFFRETGFNLPKTVVSD